MVTINEDKLALKKWLLKRNQSHLKHMRAKPFFERRDLCKSELQDIEWLKEQIKRLKQEVKEISKG